MFHFWQIMIVTVIKYNKSQSRVNDDIKSLYIVVDYIKLIAFINHINSFFFMLY